MRLITDCGLSEITEILSSEYNQPKFRAGQIMKWITRYVGFEDMSDMPLALRQKLSEKYFVKGAEIIERFVSKDGSEKYLFRLSDGNIVEGVLMDQSYGNTLCVSTQVGCRMGCAFCASGLYGLLRNLSGGEILSEVLAVNALKGGEHRAVTNIVLMGSGEPLDNYDGTANFLRLVSSPDGINISERNITLSTCGLADKIRQLADDGYKVNLTVSLHATEDEKRASVMPAAKLFSISEIVSAVKYYFNKTGRRISFEYALINGVNMSESDLKNLKAITRGYPSHINLITINKVAEKNVPGCTRKEAETFMQKLLDEGVNATIRRSRGEDIGGACGQLRNTFVKTNLTQP